jgi:hypothetical protein
LVVQKFLENNISLTTDILSFAQDVERLCNMLAGFTCCNPQPPFGIRGIADSSFFISNRMIDLQKTPLMAEIIGDVLDFYGCFLFYRTH